MQKVPDVVCLFVQANNGIHPSFIEFVNLVKRIFPNQRLQFQVIENVYPLTNISLPKEMDIECEVIAGNNSQREFSAWDKGLELLQYRGDTTQLVVLANSAFLEMYTDYLQLFEHMNFQGLDDKRFLLGHLDYYDQSKVIFGKITKAWMRTSFIITNVKTLRQMAPLAHNLDLELVKQNWHGSFEIGFFDKDFVSHARKWLLEGGLVQGHRWHGKSSSSFANESEFYKKILAILNELWLTQQALELGVEVWDVTHRSKCSICASKEIEHQLRR